jgi:TatD DNase family protein
MLVDSHAHINFEEYASELDDVIARSLDDQTWILNVGSNYTTSQKAVDIANKYKLGVWAVVGCHPIHLIKDVEEKVSFDGKEHVFSTPKEIFDYDKYYDLAIKNPKVVGIGEVGLDFYRLSDSSHSLEKVRKIQTDVFRQFIRLSRELDLPLVLHCRGEEKDPYGAYDEMLDILGSELRALSLGLKSSKPTAHSPKLQGVIHCYGGNLEQAKQFLDLGFYIGFTGIVTFKNAKELQAIAKEIPLNKILIETDAPFLAPDPFRGQRNEPSYVKYVCQKIASLKGLSFDEVAKATYENTCKLFKL